MCRIFGILHNTSSQLSVKDSVYFVRIPATATWWRNSSVRAFYSDHDSFRRKLAREQVLEYSLKNFCDHILHGVDPLESYATIIGLTRYKEPDGLQHEFVILHARLPSGVWTSKLEFWIRLDRAAIRDARKDIGGSSRSSTFPADDKVGLGSLLH